MKDRGVVDWMSVYEDQKLTGSFEEVPGRLLLELLLSKFLQVPSPFVP